MSDSDGDAVEVGHSHMETDAGEPKRNLAGLKKRDLQKELGLETDGEWFRWLKSDLVKPYWLELWNDYILREPPRKGGGVTLSRVQARMADGEADGKAKYSALTKDKTNWDAADHYACFLWWIKHENIRRNEGIFFGRNMDDDDMVSIAWSLKNVLRFMHTPSQICYPGGGATVFGTSRPGQVARPRRQRKHDVDDEDNATASSSTAVPP